MIFLLQSKISNVHIAGLIADFVKTETRVLLYIIHCIRKVDTARLCDKFRDVVMNYKTVNSVSSQLYEHLGFPFQASRIVRFSLIIEV